MQRPLALSLRDVKVQYGTKVALEGFSLDVSRGEIVGLIGPNGSGKSTALAVAAGLLEPCAGSVQVNGVERCDNAHDYASQIGYVPQDVALYDELTATRNLAFFGQLHGLRGSRLKDKIAQGLSRARLTDRANERIEGFSGGMKQRLSIAVAMLHDPTVLLLDEPTSALDIASREALITDLFRLRDDGCAILLTTHQTEAADWYCDRIVALGATGTELSIGSWKTRREMGPPREGQRRFPRNSLSPSA